MQLSSSTLTAITEKPSIIEHIDFLVGTDANSYPLADKLRNINIWYGKVTGWVLASQPNWRWDDSNYTDFPRGVSNLVAAQRDYALPVSATGKHASTFLRLNKIAVLNSAGKEIVLKLSTDDESVLNNVYGTSGLPAVYKLVANSAKIWPAASADKTTLTDGFIVYYQRTPKYFTNADAASEPSFPTIFHEVLAIGASFELASARGLANAKTLFERTLILKQDIQENNTDRNDDDKPAIRTKFSSFN